MMQNDTITKEYYLKVTYIGDIAPDIAGNVETRISAGISSAFPPNDNRTAVYTEEMSWKDADADPPAEFQQCLFIVDSKDPAYNGLILGGRYQKKHRWGHEFTTPGMGWRARWWMPIPNIPKP